MQGRRFTRTVAAARQIIEEDAGAGSWHLATIERDEPSFWRRILHRPGAGTRGASFGLGRMLHPRDKEAEGSDFPRVDSLPAQPRSETAAPKALTHRTNRASEEDLARRLAPPSPPADTPPDQEPVRRPPWLPQPSDSAATNGTPGPEEPLAFPSVDRARRPRFGLPPVSGGELPSVSSTAEERVARRLPPLRLGTAPPAADTGATTLSLTNGVRQAADQVGRAVILWTRRRSPSWSAYLPIFVPGMFAGTSSGAAKPSRRWWLVGTAGLAGLLAGVMVSLHRGELAERAAAWTGLVLPSNASDNGRGEQPAEAADALAEVAAVVRPLPPEAPAAAVPRVTESAATALPDDPEAVAPAQAPSDGDVQAQAVGSDAPAIEWQHLYRLGHEFQGKGDPEAAAEMFRLAARVNPAHGALLYDWGYLLQTQGKDQAAIEKYRAAVKLDPTHPYAHYNLGYLLQRRGDNAAALAAYQEAAKSHPENPFLQYNWGVVLERLGEGEAAVERYRRATELAPEGQPGKDAHQRLVALGIED